MRALTPGSTPAEEFGENSSGIQLIGVTSGRHGEEKSDNSSGGSGSSSSRGYKNSTTPEDPATDNPSSSELFEFVPEIHCSGGSAAAVAVGGKAAVSSGGIVNYSTSSGNGVELHPSGSSCGGGGRPATGYAEPVPEFHGRAGNGSGGGIGAAGLNPVQSSVSNHSQGSERNTYGPLAAIGLGGDKFPAIHPYDDMMDSPGLAEEAFARRLGGGRGEGTGGAGPERKGDTSSSPASAASRGVVRGTADGGGVFPGFVEHGGEEGSGTGVLHLSPAEPLASAFPAPMTNAFPASTDTPESEFRPGSRGYGRRPDGEGSALSASPASLFMSGDSRSKLLGPSPAASEFTPAGSAERQMLESSPAASDDVRASSAERQLLRPCPPASEYFPARGGNVGGGGGFGDGGGSMERGARSRSSSSVKDTARRGAKRNSR